MIFKTGYVYGHDVLVLSAHGCGAWGGPTHDIAEVYRELVEEYQGCFRAVLFAILGSKILAGLPVSNLDIFAETFYVPEPLGEAPPPTTTRSTEQQEQQEQRDAHYGGEEPIHEAQGSYRPPVYDPNPPPLSNTGAIPTNVQF